MELSASEQKLFEAVRTAPDDDAPRLVLADALLERGSPLGELIATQCALAREDLPRAQAIALRRRERDLLAEAQAWTGLGDIPCELRRGFVEAITIGVDRLLLEFVDVLRRAPLLREVRLTGHARPEVIEQVIDLPGIEGVSFDADGGAPIDRLARQKRLGKLTRLKALNVVAGDPLAALGDAGYVDGLEHLHLAGRLSSAESSAEARSRLPGPKTLLRPRTLALVDDYVSYDVGYWLDLRVREGDGTALFERVDDLRIGPLWRSFRGGDRTLAFEGTGVLRRLSRLGGDSDFSARDLRLVTESRELSKLRELHLHRQRHAFQAIDLAPLCAETALSSLRVLSLRQHVVSADAARALLRSPLAAQLEVLDLRQNAAVAPIGAELQAAWDGLLLF